MHDRAEIIWDVYERLRRDVMLSDRCSALCNTTLVEFAEAVYAPVPAATGDPIGPVTVPAGLRYLCDEALAAVDRAVERAVTGHA